MAVSASFGGEFKRDKSHQKSGWRCQSVGSYRKMPMTAAAFSADGSVLAVAAETVITFWDSDKNALVAVIGDTFTVNPYTQPITTLWFTGKSEYLVALSQGSNPQLALWDLSKFSIFWSYRLYAEAISCTEDGSQFVVLALINSPNEPVCKDQDGIILLFDVQNPVSLATWMVKKGCACMWSGFGASINEIGFKWGERRWSSFSVSRHFSSPCRHGRYRWKWYFVAGVYK